MRHTGSPNAVWRGSIPMYAAEYLTWVRRKPYGRAVEERPYSKHLFTGRGARKGPAGKAWSSTPIHAWVSGVLARREPFEPNLSGTSSHTRSAPGRVSCVEVETRARACNFEAHG